MAGMVLLLAAATLVLVGSATAARHRARSAADLAAFGAALEAFEGEDVACARAAEVTARNDARLVACRLEGLDAIVTVEVGVAGFTVRASARAGPVG